MGMAAWLCSKIGGFLGCRKSLCWSMALTLVAFDENGVVVHRNYWWRGCVVSVAIAVVAVNTQKPRNGGYIDLHSLSRSGKSTLMPDCYEIRNAITVISGELDRSMAMVGGPGCKCASAGGTSKFRWSKWFHMVSWHVQRWSKMDTFPNSRCWSAKFMYMLLYAILFTRWFDCFWHMILYIGRKM